jgi:hypothetical protein
MREIFLLPCARAARRWLRWRPRDARERLLARVIGTRWAAFGRYRCPDRSYIGRRTMRNPGVVTVKQLRLRRH